MKDFYCAPLLVCAIASSVFVAPANAAPQSAASQSHEDLGEQLLEGDLLKDILPRTRDGKAEPSLAPDVDKLRRMLDPNLPQPSARQDEGEDLGQQKESPLVDISNQMERAGRLIASQDTTGKARETQEAIVADLDALIEKLNKQCQKCSGGQCKKPSAAQQSQASTPKPGGGKPSAAQGSQSQQAQSKVSAGGGGDAQPGEVTDSDMVKQLWGQLPERLRQQLLQSSADEFLPKYRDDLEAYFRRLAEEQATFKE